MQKHLRCQKKGKICSCLGFIKYLNPVGTKQPQDETANIKMTECARLHLSRWKRPRWPHGSDSGRIIKAHHVTCQTWRQTTFPYQIKLGSDAIRVTFTPQKQSKRDTGTKARGSLFIRCSDVSSIPRRARLRSPRPLIHQRRGRRRYEVSYVCRYATSRHCI